jgi:hypothetical protein
MCAPLAGGGGGGLSLPDVIRGGLSLPDVIRGGFSLPDVVRGGGPPAGSLVDRSLGMEASLVMDQPY